MNSGSQCIHTVVMSVFKSLALDSHKSDVPCIDFVAATLA